MMVAFPRINAPNPLSAMLHPELWGNERKSGRSISAGENSKDASPLPPWCVYRPIHHPLLPVDCWHTRAVRVICLLMFSNHARIIEE